MRIGRSVAEYGSTHTMSSQTSVRVRRGLRQLSRSELAYALDEIARRLPEIATQPAAKVDGAVHWTLRLLLGPSPMGWNCADWCSWSNCTSKENHWPCLWCKCPEPPKKEIPAAPENRWGTVCESQDDPLAKELDLCDKDICQLSILLSQAFLMDDVIKILTDPKTKIVDWAKFPAAWAVHVKKNCKINDTFSQSPLECGMTCNEATPDIIPPPPPAETCTLPCANTCLALKPDGGCEKFNATQADCSKKNKAFDAHSAVRWNCGTWQFK